MNKLSAVVLLFASAACAADITVRVTDPRNAAIPGANVVLLARDGDRRVATTGADGSGHIANLAAGQYFMEVEAPGFDRSAPQPVDLQNGQLLDVAVSLGVAEVHSSVVVTASGTPQTTDELSKALTVVDSDTIALRDEKSVGEALDDVPGLRVQQLGGPLSTTYFKIRGLRNQDTALLVDGLRLRDPAGPQGDASGVLQDLVITDTNRIEVLRGAGSSLYGTDATGGVVNIVTGEGGGRTRGSISVDGGSLSSVRAMARLAGALADDRFQYSFGVTHWNVMSGVDGDSPARNTSGQGQATWRLSRIASLTARIYSGDTFGFLRLSPIPVGNLPATGIVNAVAVSLSQQHLYETGIPLSQLALGHATFLPDAFDPDSTRAGHFFTGAVTFTVRPSDRLAFTTQFQHLSTTRNYGDGPAGPDYQPTGTNISTYEGNIDTANARFDFSLGRFQRLDAGYEFEHEEFQNRLLPPPPDAGFFTGVSQRSHALFAQDQFRFLDGRLQIAAAYRAQFFSLDAPQFQPVSGAPFAGKFFSAPPTAQTGDLSAAYTFRKTGTKLRAHAGRAYRAPSLYERFGAYFYASSYSLYGDPGLRPDRANSIDGGVDQTLWNARVRLSATYFYTRLNEVIIFDGTVTPATDPLGRYGGYRNAGGGLARGIEFSSAIAATRSFELRGAYTYTYTDARQEAALAPGVWQTYQIPKNQYSFSATQRFTPRLIGFFAYTGSTSYLSPVYGQPFRFGGPSRARAGISYRRPLSEFRALRFYQSVDNLFNQTYFEDGFRTPGITSTSGIQFEF